MLQKLLADLNNPNAAIRAEARRKACALSPEAFQQLIELEAMQRNRWQRPRLYLAISAAVALLVGSVYSSGWVLLLLIMLGLNLYVTTDDFRLFLDWITQRNRSSQTMCYLAKIMTETQDTRFLAIALNWLYWGYVQQRGEHRHLNHPEVEPYLRTIIKRTLPQFCADPTFRLTWEQMRALLYLLESPYLDAELTLCVLQVLEQVGDAEAIPLIQRITSDSAAVSLQRVRLAAHKCLFHLEERKKQAHQAQTLLRPSDARTFSAPNVLLRPAATNPEVTPSEQLLRPHFSEE